MLECTTENHEGEWLKASWIGYAASQTYYIEIFEFTQTKYIVAVYPAELVYLPTIEITLEQSLPHCHVLADCNKFIIETQNIKNIIAKALPDAKIGWKTTWKN